MTDTESLIRDALLRQADRAPQPGGVLAALHRPRRRRKPLFLALATAATAAAVAVAVTAIPRPAATDAPPAGQSAPVVTTSGGDGPTSASIGDTLPLEFTPAWLPDGFAETQRAWGERGVQRIWRQVAGPSLWLEVGSAPLPDGEPTTVNGEPAVFGEDHLHWRLAGRTLSAEAKQVPDARGVLRRFAESVRPDPTRIAAPLHAEGMRTLSVDARSADDWNVATVLEIGDRKYSLSLGTGVAPTLWPVTTTTPTTALGRDAVYEDGRYSLLKVTLVPGRILSVGTLKDVHVPADELVAVLEKVRYAQNPDLSWAVR